MTTLAQNQETPPATRAAERLEQRPIVAPPVDIYENANEVLVVADMPGVTAEGLTVRIDGSELVLEARRAPRSHGAELVVEHRPADYRRTFVLPRTIDSTRIEADLKAGVLRLRLPKAEAVKPRRIAVTNG